VHSDSTVTLYTLPDFGKTGTMVLSHARNAHGFAITTYTALPSKKKGADPGLDIPVEQVLRDILVVGCRKKVVVFGAGKGGIKEAWVYLFPSDVVGIRSLLYRSFLYLTHLELSSYPPLLAPPRQRLYRYPMRSTSSTHRPHRSYYTSTLLPLSV
jgi:hypothetical protein